MGSLKGCESVRQGPLAWFQGGRTKRMRFQRYAELPLKEENWIRIEQHIVEVGEGEEGEITQKGIE